MSKPVKAAHLSRPLFPGLRHHLKAYWRGFGPVAVALGASWLAMPGRLALSADTEPIPFFQEVGTPAADVRDAAKRTLASYPDATRHRIVTVNAEVIDRVFGDLTIPETGPLPMMAVSVVDVGDAVGVGTGILLNFFADRQIETTVRRSSALAYRGINYSLLLSKTGQSSAEPFVSIDLKRWKFGEEYVRLNYRNGYDGDSYYSIRTLPGTPFHVVIERNRGPQHGAWSVVRRAISTRDAWPVRIDGGTAGIVAEIGPLIDYGLADISFGDSQVGYAITSNARSGHPPRAFKTIDGGETWKRWHVEPDWVPIGVHFRSRNDGYLSLRFNPVGHGIQNIRGCALLHTRDGGNSWRRLQDAGRDYCVGDLQFSKDGTGYAIGWDRPGGTAWIWRSTDGAEWSRWVELPSSVVSVNRIEIVGEELVIVPHLGLFPPGCGILRLGADGQFLPPICLTYPQVNQLRFVSRDEIFANVHDELGQYLLRSEDGGSTWHRILEEHFTLVYTASAREVGILVKKGRSSATDTSIPYSAFAYTDDGGKSWAEGPITDISPYDDGKSVKLGHRTELTLLGNRLLHVSGN